MQSTLSLMRRAFPDMPNLKEPAIPPNVCRCAAANTSSEYHYRRPSSKRKMGGRRATTPQTKHNLPIAASTNGLLCGLSGSSRRAAVANPLSVRDSEIGLANSTGSATQRCPQAWAPHYRAPPVRRHPARHALQPGERCHMRGPAPKDSYDKRLRLAHTHTERAALAR